MLLSRRVAVTFAAVLAACASQPRMDLRANVQLYQPTGYRAKAPATMAVWVAPMVDERQVPDDSAKYPTGYLIDGDWERPMPEMVHDILVDELRSTGVFKEVVDAPAPDVLIVRPTLRSCDGGLQEQPYGRRSLSRVALNIEVQGPERDGARPVWLDEPFADQQLSNTGFRPPSPRALLGLSLHLVMARMLATIDASGVGRGEPVEAVLKRTD